MEMTLDIEGLSCRLNGRAILHDIQGLSARSGEITALIGPNGAGKSTLLKAVAGIEPASGRIYLDDRDIGALSLEKRAQDIYYLAQDNSTQTVLTVFEAVLLARRTCLAEPIATALHAVHSTLLVLELEELAERQLVTLSGGQRQRVAIAQAVVREPHLLLLDEPTSALDLHHQLQVLDWLSRLATERNIIVIIAMHDLSMAARFSQRMWVVKSGHSVISGPPRSVLTQAMLREVYAIDSHIEWPTDAPPRVTPLAAIQRLGNSTKYSNELPP